MKYYKLVKWDKDYEGAKLNTIYPENYIPDEWNRDINYHAKK